MKYIVNSGRHREEECMMKLSPPAVAGSRVVGDRRRRWTTLCGTVVMAWLSTDRGAMSDLSCLKCCSVGRMVVGLEVLGRCVHSWGEGEDKGMAGGVVMTAVLR